MNSRLWFASLLILFLPSIGAQALPRSGHVESSEIRATCPANVKDWIELRNAQRSAKSLTDVLAFGALVQRCESEPPTTKLFDQNPQLRKCLEPFANYSKIAVENEGKTAGLDELNSLKTLGPEAARLPRYFRNFAFWQVIRSGRPSRIEEALKKAARELPGSAVLKYTSFLQPRTPLILVAFDEPETQLRRFVHFDLDLNINLLSLRTSSPGQQVLGSLQVPTGPEALDAPIDTNEGRCYRCHQSAAIAIVPRDRSSITWYSTAAQANRDPLTWLNRQFLESTSTGYEKFFDSLPALGERAPSAKELQACFPAASPKRRAQLGSALMCAHCHDGLAAPKLFLPLGTPAEVVGSEVKLNHRIHAELGVGTNVDGPAALLQHFVLSRHMPVDMENLFSQEERKQIFDCLMSQYLGRLDGHAVKRTIEPGALLSSLLENSCR